MKWHEVTGPDMEAVMLTAQEILDIGSDDLERVFGPDVSRALDRLLRGWHPDLCADPQADAVTRHIIGLRKMAGRESTASAGSGGGRFATRVFAKRDGGTLRIRALSGRKVDQGEILVARTALVTIFPEDAADLARTEAGIASSFRFADEAMRNQMQPFLPDPVRDEPLAGGRLVAVRKMPEEILLADLLDRKAVLPPVHAAWLCSGLMNIVAWLEHAGLMHGAIAPEHVLIDPARHSVRLAAGWAFCTSLGARPGILAGRTADLLPALLRPGTTAGVNVDLELVRQTLREALGAPCGTGPTITALPAPIAAWLRFPPPTSAVADYRAWQAALEEAWGPRRFSPCAFSASDIYGTEA